MMDPWRIEGSRTLIQDRWLTIRADRCRTSAGDVIEPYYVIEAPTWVSIFAVTATGEVILATEYRHGAQILAPGLPGGAVEPTDSGPHEAAARELREETGYAAGRLIELGRGFANWGNHSNEVVYFLALDCIPDGDQMLDDHEMIDVGLEPVDVVLRPGFLSQSFHMANAFLASHHLSAAGEEQPV